MTELDESLTTTTELSTSKLMREIQRLNYELFVANTLIKSLEIKLNSADNKVDDSLVNEEDLVCKIESLIDDLDIETNYDTEFKITSSFITNKKEIIEKIVKIFKSYKIQIEEPKVETNYEENQTPHISYNRCVCGATIINSKDKCKFCGRNLH